MIELNVFKFSCFQSLEYLCAIFQICSYSMVFIACARVTEMDYARKMDRSTRQPVKEMDCTSEMIYVMG